ncbi:MAG: hypothetical protein H7323_12320 [Frankiales bacterium]|nr:hypothetical protein [Frankiales bacterium]
MNHSLAALSSSPTRPVLRRRPGLLRLTLAGSMLLGAAACSDDPAQAPVASATASSAPSAGMSAATVAPSLAVSPTPAASFAGDTRPDTAQAAGGPLSVTRVRVARQAGFDRVVFTLEGKAAGVPGWRVAYDSAPSQQGSGKAVKVGGAATLAVIITGVGYPFDTGAQEASQDPNLPGDLQVVRDVVVGSVFEGQFEAFIGLDAQRAFTVRRLASPARVVVDISH